MLKKLLLFFSKNSFKKYSLIILGTVSWSLVMVRSGLCWDTGCFGGLGFWGANGHDGIWHIALAESLSQGFGGMPIFAGSGIQNYHIGFDLLLAALHKITLIPIVSLYFQIVPPVLAFFVGLLTYKFVSIWTKSEKASLWSTFFVYFGGSFGWLVSLFRGQGLGGESMFWAQQSISTLINPPFTISLITILLGLIYLQKYSNNRSLINSCLAVLFFGISIFVKVYAGLLVLSSLLAISVWQIIKRKDYSIFWVLMASFAVSLLLFIPFNKTSIGLIVWQPFWFLESMMTYSDRFNWPRMYSAMTTYRMGHIWIKAVLAYGLSFAIFIIGNFGSRIIAFKLLFKNPKKIISAGPIEIFLFTLILAGIIVPTLFVQKGTPWNTIQFFYYSLFFSGILAGIALGRIFDKVKSGTYVIIIGVAVILLTISTTVASMGNYLPASPQSTLPVGEMEALEFLSGQPRGVVLAYPYDPEKSAREVAPRPLFLYTSTAYVSAFSGQPVFLEDQMNLDIMQYPWAERRKSVEDFLNTFDIESARSFLKENNITYVYWLKDQHARIGDKQLKMTKIFENDSATIFKVD